MKSKGIWGSDFSKGYARNVGTMASSDASCFPCFTQLKIRLRKKGPLKAKTHRMKTRLSQPHSITFAPTQNLS